MRKKRLLLGVLFCILLLVPCFSLQQEKDEPGTLRPLELSDVLKWKNIWNAVISDNGQWFVYRLAPNEGDNEVVIRKTDEDNDHNLRKPPIWPIGWVKDGKSVLLTDKWDIWRVPVHGGGGTNLTVNGKREGIRYSYRPIFPKFPRGESSAYNSIYWSTGQTHQALFESGQGRFTGGFWHNLESYIRNSPVLFADRVKTPLLMFHNDKDGAVDWHQGIEFFNSLRRLGKPVIMLQYRGEGHGLQKPASRKDFFIRRKEFFDHHLMGKPSPKWLKEGVPYLKIKEHLKKGGMK